MLVIADSSPLVYLSRVGVLDLLATAFGEVVVPATVWAEVVDARADAVAQERGLVVRGTLGVLVHARQHGALPALRPVLEALVGEGFRISPALVAEALRRVGEE